MLVAACAVEQLQITRKKQSYPEKQLSVERTYRGKQCIAIEITEGSRRTRAFSINSKTVMAESDEDNDGFFESFMIFDPATGDFEWFIRTTNNIVVPVSSERLQEARSRKRAADKALTELIGK